MIFLRGIGLVISFILIWQLSIYFFKFPPYIVPSPYLVFMSLIQNSLLISQQAVPTLIETFLGLFLGALLGLSTALMMIFFRPIKLWFLPLLLISQALPTFAIAPLFIIWFGYGMASKIAITIIMLFFPVASAFYDGLRRTPRDYLDLAKTMQATHWQLLKRIQIPYALPSLATGLRVAATIAPIGAVIGEWVGSSSGLGFLLLNANARMQIDLMFAVLIVITMFTLFLYYSIDWLLKTLITW
ncbi:MAG: ABC transporter permease [Gammaproteobacteria bacterium RIFCSPHIGHO2_12_FULL_35_23]|nr:MAG: ABC transporter permease [Gammaproteobacteria bacterium RIFCSPHIGHO2_12_FULL_35_23]